MLHSCPSSRPPCGGGPGVRAAARPARRRSGPAPSCSAPPGREGGSPPSAGRRVLGSLRRSALPRPAAPRAPRASRPGQQGQGRRLGDPGHLDVVDVDRLRAGVAIAGGEDLVKRDAADAVGGGGRLVNASSKAICVQEPSLWTGPTRRTCRRPGPVDPDALPLVEFVIPALNQNSSSHRTCYARSCWGERAAISAVPRAW